ncbi:hypothetical protein [Leptothoe spongobia]|uniref:Uncharacterized protein n=1 Tax=Leptothoe spongobia TAU-MAC 1115 TaxID=1967444 RepID=A0A947GJW2_9CYAN|nr:hypothetical protein [Leptothoe spongobia]MBT9316333.1 hypothetical protein [Leptothoe spongobia TAU-MAC 1115]
MPPKQSPIDSLAEATNAKLGRLEEAVISLAESMKAQAEVIKTQDTQTRATIEQQGQTTQTSIDRLSGEMRTFLEALNRLERGIGRMVNTWESQNRFLQEVVQRQNQSTERLQALADQQMQMLNKALDAMVFSKN